MQEGPFALADQFSLNFALELEYKNAQALGNAYDQHPAVLVLEKMVEMKRQGKNKGAGFYEYNDKTDERTFWAGLEEHFPLAKQLLSAQEIKDRIMFVQCIEAARCLEEGIVKSSADANLGSIYGWGFPAFKGGVLQFINDYGVPEFVERAHQLQTRYGKRFAVPNLLLEMVKEQTNFI
jgi:3-hydroxyacyl-CoA dehydrogenase/enoyl-CoA hydratase/3-hydroxybutyryl-CoA epimerase